QRRGEALQRRPWFRPDGDAGRRDNQRAATFGVDQHTEASGQDHRPKSARLTMSIPLVTFERPSGSALWYTIDLSNQDFLAGQSLASVTVTVISGLITIVDKTVSGKSVLIRITGATGGRAKLQVKATAQDGQIFDQPVDFVTTNRAA